MKPQAPSLLRFAYQFLLLGSIAGAPLGAAENFRDDFGTVTIWQALPSWLSNPVDKPTLTSVQGVASFGVADPRRGMKWERPCPLEVDAKFHVVALRYSAVNVQPSDDFALLLAADKAETKLVPLSRLTCDGEWHVLAIPVPADDGGKGPATPRTYSGIVVHVQSNDAGQAELKIDWLVLCDAPPAGSEP